MYIPMLDPSQTMTLAGYRNQGHAEYVGNFWDTVFVNGNVSRHQQPVRRAQHVPHRASHCISPDKDGAEGELRHWLQAPTLNQLYVSFPSGTPFFNFFSNPRLKPEESRGLRRRFRAAVVGRSYSASARPTSATGSRSIQITSPDANFNTTLDNLASAKTYGFEAFAQLRLSDEFMLRADYTYTVAQNATPIAATEAAILTELNRQIAEGTTQADPVAPSAPQGEPAGDVEAGAEADPVGDAGAGRRPGRTSAATAISRHRAGLHAAESFSGSYDLADGVTATARIDNIGNKQYQNPIGFRAPGLSAIGGLRMTY